jgi:glycosyltransferase involved in cell wall biosynthesis
MKVLVVARCKNGKFAPFITEQVVALEMQGVECVFFGVHNRGLLGYLRQYPRLLRELASFRPDIVHAHYGLCGVFANFQRRIPVVTTYHGSDINDPNVLRLSRVSIRLSRFNIFVSKNNIETAAPKRNYALIPCGINLKDYPLIGKAEARRRMGLSQEGRFVLFAGAFDNLVKNAALAKEAVSLLPDVKLIELKGYSREEVAALMQAVDALLMTSHTEGSPQVIKEAMACGCPIVSVDVGDVKEIVEGVDGCFISEASPKALSESLQKAFRQSGRTLGRCVIIQKGLTNDLIASCIVNVYKKICITIHAKRDH